MTYKHEWYPHSVCFTKDPHNEDEEDLFTGTVVICVDGFWGKVHETYIDPWICNAMHEPSFIATQIVSQVRIADAKFTYATIINDLYEEVFEGRRQDVPYHRTFTSKERHSDVNQSYLSEICQIGLGAATNKLKATTKRMLQLAIMTISRQYRYDRMLKRPRTEGKIFTETMESQYKPLDGNHYAKVFANDSLFTAAYPMDKKSLAGQGLRGFTSDFGVMELLV